MHFLRFFVCLFLFAGSFSVVQAHQVDLVELEFKDLGQKWQLTGEIDIAYMLPETRNVPGGLPLSRTEVMNYPAGELARIRKETEIRLRELIRLSFSDKDLPWRIEFPDFQSAPLVLPIDAADAALITCVLVVDAVPKPGELRIHWAGEQETELMVLTETGSEMKIVSTLPGGSLMLLKRDAAGQSAPVETPVTGGWVQMGYHHVLPEGRDHMLFILGLFLLAPNWKALMGQSLLFTLAHSVTLALAVFGVLKIPEKLFGIQSPVEVFIAISIAVIGIENLLTRKLGRQRLILVFTFGLLHGMGFASSIGDKMDGVPRSQLAGPLLGFNVGVELAQITILIAAFLVLRLLKKWTLQVQTIGSALVALAGVAWAVQRVFFPESPIF
jgi:hypothetical protein